MTWVYHPPGTESASALAVVASIWASCWPNPDFTQDVLSSGSLTPDHPSSRHSSPDTLPQPQSGTTSPHSMPSHSLVPLIQSLPDTHVSRSAWQDSARGPMTHATYGPTSPALPENSATGCDGYFLRTSRATSPLALTPCCESYETWASRLRLAYSQRKKLARRTKGSGGSAWPTSRAEDSESSGMRHSRGVADTLTAVVGLWPTPMAGTPAQNGNSASGSSDFSRKAEELARGLWVTPQARDFRSPDSPDSPRRQRKADQGWSENLNDQTSTWPTPAARDHKGENSPDHLANGTGRLHMDQLPNAVAHGFSRPAQAMQSHGVTLSQLRPIWRPLRASVIVSHGRATWRRLWKSRAKRRLNPLFVEWLMGWPPGHALCACSEMELSHWQQRMRGALSHLPMASGPWIWLEPAPQPILTQANLFGDM